MAAADAAALGTLSDVQYVEFQGEYTERSNVNVRSIVQSGALNNTPLYNRGLHGEGQIVGLIDSDLNKDHCSFSDTVPIGPNHRKILAYNTFFGSPRTERTWAARSAATPAPPPTPGASPTPPKWSTTTSPTRTSPASSASSTCTPRKVPACTTTAGATAPSAPYDGACHAIDSLSHDQEDNLIVFATTDFNIPVHQPRERQELPRGRRQRRQQHHGRAQPGVLLRRGYFAHG